MESLELSPGKEFRPTGSDRGPTDSCTLFNYIHMMMMMMMIIIIIIIIISQVYRVKYEN